MPPMSPRTQQLQAGMNAGPDQETALFEQGMSDMAYNLLSSKMPDVMQDVVTFKVIRVDVDKGSGVGAFVVLRHDQPVYIPVVLVDNAVKPLEVFYHKTMNVFLPLTKGWLDEIDKTALSSLGKGIKTPETLYTDVDIRNVVVPPVTGRFSYAAASVAERAAHDRAVAAFPLDVALSVRHLEKTAAAPEPAPMLLALLDRAPNRVKKAFVRLLEKNPSLTKVAAATYGVSAIAGAVRPRLEKVAAKQLTGGALWIVDKDNTPTDFHRIFGDRAGEAYAGVRKKGFAAKDERLTRNMAVQEQPFEHWTEPNQPGVYCLYDSSGKERHAFVMPDPIDVLGGGAKYARRPIVPGKQPRQGETHRDYGYGRPDEGSMATRRPYNARPYLAVFGDGSYLEASKLVGRSSEADDLAGKLHARLFDAADGAPRAGKGFFVRKLHSVYQATVPVEIKSVSTGSDGVRRMKITGMGGYPEKTICTDPTHPYGAVWMPKGADIVYLPPDFTWIPLKERLDEGGWFQSALDLQAHVSWMLSSVGAKKVAVKDAGARQFSIDGAAAVGYVPALKKLAHGCAISVEDAARLLEKAASERVARAWVASPAQLARVQLAMDKLAADDDKGGDKKKSDSGDKPKKKSSSQNGAGGSGGPPGAGDPGMDPSQGGDPSLGQDAAMAAMGGPPPAPPPPAPLDLAAMEMDQAIQHEMQKLVERQQTIQQLLARSHEIGGGAPVAPMVQSQAMGAPPPSTNLATGGPPTMGPSPTGPLPPQPGADPSIPPGMDPGGQFPPAAGDPSMMGGGADPSQGGMFGAGGGAPGGDPSTMGGMPGGMDPSMGMGGPGGAPGMDPSQMGGMGGMGQQPQPPNATMPADGPNTQALQQEVNPQFLMQAAQLHSADMFDAAAVATLAQSPELHGVVEQYLPNLEKAIDNLARVLLTLWMQEPDLKQQIGESAFAGIEENMQSTFKGLGDLVLRLSRGVQAVKEPDDHAA